jgi:hypothetical protein
MAALWSIAVPRLDSPGARPQPRAREASASSRCAPHRTCALWRPFNFPPGCVAASDSVPARAGQQHGGRTADAPLGAAVSGLVTRCLGTAGDGVSRGLGPVRLWKISEKRRVDQHKRMQLILEPRWLVPPSLPTATDPRRPIAARLASPAPSRKHAREACDATAESTRRRTFQPGT